MRNDLASDATATTFTEETSTTMSFVDVEMPGQTLTCKVTPRHDVIGLLSGLSTTQACVTIQAKELQDDDANSRAPVDIVAAIDVSGSMHGNKLKLCKKTLKLLLRVLSDKDRFGLISYASESVVEIPAQYMTAANKKSALAKIESLCTRGSTNISGAIGLAAQEMLTIEKPNEVRAIFLLTDGHANTGISDTAGIVEVTKNCLGASATEEMSFGTTESNVASLSQAVSESAISSGVAMPANMTVTVPSRIPIAMHCFGYGSDHDENMLNEIAAATPGGTYYFVENDSDVGTAFGDALGGVLSVVAQSAVVTIKVPTESSNLGVEIVDVYHDQKLKRENGTYTVTVGDFYAEESRDILFKVKLANSSGGVLIAPIPHAVVSLSYTDTVLKRLVETKPAVCSIVRSTTAEISESHQHVDVQWLRYSVAEEIQAADIMGRNHDLAGARARLQGALRGIEASPASYRVLPVVHQLSTDLGSAIQGLTSKEDYDTWGSKTMKVKARSNKTQRCYESSEAVGNVYRSSKKSDVAKKFKFGPK